MYKMALVSKIKSHSDLIDYFKELPFYNELIKKPKFKPLNKIDQLLELPFYSHLDVIKTDQACSGGAISCKLEIIEKMIQFDN